MSYRRYAALLGDATTLCAISCAIPSRVGRAAVAGVNPSSASTAVRQQGQELATMLVIDNEKSGEYHLTQCAGYSQINFKNRVEFASEADAAGYLRAGTCP